MFSSSSSEDEAEATPTTPFNAITAAAKAVRARTARQKQQEIEVKAILAKAPEPKKRIVPERKSRYIASLVASTKARQEELQRVAERKLAEEAAQTGEERYVTPAYRRVLEERERGEREPEVDEEGMRSVERVEEGLKSGMDGSEDEKGRNEGEKKDEGEERSGEVVEGNGKREGVEERIVVKERKKRGMRRNDERAIEAYRQRYFERRARRLGGREK